VSRGRRGAGYIRADGDAPGQLPYLRQCEPPVIAFVQARLTASVALEDELDRNIAEILGGWGLLTVDGDGVGLSRKGERWAGGELTGERPGWVTR